MPEQFKAFLLKLLGQLATGNFTVLVDCQDNKQFPADVIGYDEELMRIKVRFHADTLTKPGTKRVPRTGWGFGGTGEDAEYDLVSTQVPVKEESIWWESIILD